MKTICIIPVFPPRDPEVLKRTIESMKDHAPELEIVVVTVKTDKYDKCGAKVRKFNAEGSFPKSKLMNMAASSLKDYDYYLFHDADFTAPPMYGRIINLMTDDGIDVCGLCGAFCMLKRECIPSKENMWGYGLSGFYPWEEVKSINLRPGVASLFKRDFFFSIGQWCEKHTSWGPEDAEMAQRISRIDPDWWSRGVKFPMSHQWHPLSKRDSNTKDMMRELKQRNSNGNVDVVYIYRKMDSDQLEIKTSIGLMRKYGKGVKNIYVVGDNPEINGIIHVPETDPYQNKEANMIHKTIAACNIKGISSPFILQSDDQYVVAPYDFRNLPLLYKKGYPLDTKKSGTYAARVQSTAEEMKRLGFTLNHYDIHVPTPIIPEKYIEAMALVKWQTNGQPGVLSKSVYGNYVGGGIPINDPKSAIQERIGQARMSPFPFMSSSAVMTKKIKMVLCSETEVSKRPVASRPYKMIGSRKVKLRVR